MTTKNPATNTSARKKLIARIAVTQRRAITAKKTATLAKFGYRRAKKKFKDARRAARKLRKAVRKLKRELAVLAARKPRHRRAASHSARPLAMAKPGRVRSRPVRPAVTAPALIVDQPVTAAFLVAAPV